MNLWKPLAAVSFFGVVTARVIAGAVFAVTLGMGASQRVSFDTATTVFAILCVVAGPLLIWSLRRIGYSGGMQLFLGSLWLLVTVALGALFVILAGMA